jgi:hypothetical protein
VNVIHIGLVSRRGRDFIFFDKVRVDVTAGTGAEKVERIYPGPGVGLLQDVMPSVAILATGRFSLPLLLRKSVDAGLIRPVRIRMTGRAAGGNKGRLALNLMSPMAIRTGGNRSMDASGQGIPGFSAMARSANRRLHLLGMGNPDCLRVAIPAGKIPMSGLCQPLGIDGKQALFSPVNHPGDF